MTTPTRYATSDPSDRTHNGVHPDTGETFRPSIEHRFCAGCGRDFHLADEAHAFGMRHQHAYVASATYEEDHDDAHPHELEVSTSDPLSVYALHCVMCGEQYEGVQAEQVAAYLGITLWDFEMNVVFEPGKVVVKDDDEDPDQ